MNPSLLNKEVQAFLQENHDVELDRLILKGSPFEDVSARELAEQIQSRRKCKAKLPLWYETHNIVYPPTLSIEQSSSERAARYKASLIKGDRLIDLTGGFGVDSYYFSKKFNRVVHVEMDRELHGVVRHNLEILNADNVSCICGDSMTYLKSSTKSFDWSYLDPSRRDERKERVFRLEDCSPNLLENLELILSRSDRVLVKLAPFMDISQAVNQLKNVYEVHILAIENEVKELLFLLGGNPGISQEIKAVNLMDSGSEILSGYLSDPNDIQYGPVQAYLYEPNAAIRKAGLYAALSSQYELYKLHPNSHLFTGSELIEFPGRTFRVVREVRYNAKRLKKELGLQRANITTRNFHDSVAQIRKRTGIKEGGQDYLFFTTDHRGSPVVLQCTKTRDKSS